jgi:tetratricopeptide (TPR) repeat protein
LVPDLVPALNNLAWVLATDREAMNRNGAEAVRLAERACTLTDRQIPVLVGTLAAAYAEAGRFKEAIETAQQARALAQAAGQPEVAERNRQLLALYQSGQAFHELPTPASTTTHGGFKHRGGDGSSPK